MNRQRNVRLFLCGDVMCGRGIDQVLPRCVDPELHELSGISARGYVKLAEQRSGPLPRPMDYADIWGDALRIWRDRQADARIVNLETALTTSDDWQAKGINYRAHPDNVELLRVAGIDCCVLANNHVLDWGVAGLRETLTALRRAGIASAGAGVDAAAAAAPAQLPLPGAGRVLVFAMGMASSGIPATWAAGAQPGVNYLADLSDDSVARIARDIAALRRRDDLVVLSIHWGGNWGYGASAEQRRFARALIERAGVDVIHGHSSHHPKGIEVYRDRPIFYGCGDFINDYEGIGGYEYYRGDLCLMYFATFTAQRRLLELRMVPLRIHRFGLHRAGAGDAQWLGRRLTQASEPWRARFEPDGDELLLRWRD